MTRLADLHIHTNYSDSTQSPHEVINEAHEKGLACIAITDHDTIDGVVPAMEAAKPYDIEVIPGIELSSEAGGKDIHILGYLFDYKNKSFVERIKYIQNARVERMREMIDNLRTLGIDNITLDDVRERAESDSVGRPHLAAIMLEKGWVSSIKKAFDDYLADDAPVYVPKFQQSPFEAIDLIKSAGGIAVLAHPMLTGVDELIPGFVEAGLLGLEVFYPNNTDHVTRFYEGLAKKYNLIGTGGSDAHGTVKKYTSIGKVKVPYSIVEQLKDACSA
jgi:predicted metal-dependent phosphoesterase TrpH